MAQQDAKFISLHDTLQTLSEADGCTYEVAARGLLRALNNTAAHPNTPKWFKYSMASGVIEATPEFQEHAKCVLYGVADCSKQIDEWWSGFSSHDLNNYGFDITELEEFLPVLNLNLKLSPSTMNKTATTFNESLKTALNIFDLGNGDEELQLQLDLNKMTDERDRLKKENQLLHAQESDQIVMLSVNYEKRGNALQSERDVLAAELDLIRRHNLYRPQTDVLDEHKWSQRLTELEDAKAEHIREAEILRTTTEEMNNEIKKLKYDRDHIHQRELHLENLLDKITIIRAERDALREKLDKTLADLVIARNKQKSNDDKRKVFSIRERNALLKLVGAMLELMKSPRPGREVESAIITELVENYSDADGISPSNLQKKFAEAKRILTTP